MKQYQVLHTFFLNKSYAYLLKVEPSNLVCNTEFDEIIITFTDQNGRPLVIDYNVNLIITSKLLINK